MSGIRIGRRRVRVDRGRPTNAENCRVYNPQLTFTPEDTVADKYSSFAELVQNEPPGAYSIRWRKTESTIAVIAPHGGAIEPGTSEIALEIAGADLSYYLFDGQKAKENSALHITSTRFDEPICRQLIATAVNAGRRLHSSGGRKLHTVLPSVVYCL